MRKAYGADLVSMFVSELETGCFGRGYGLGAEDMPNGISNLAFSVVKIQNAADAPRYSFIHELGHNMGAGHHKEQNVEHGPQVYTYSAGWRWVGSDTNRYCSVMSYTEGFSDGQTYARVPYFSNPSISHLGAATGSAVDGDNARTIRETKHLTATYSSEWTNSQAANLVLGQSNFSTDSGGAGAGNMYHPNDVAVDWATGKIFVADAWNNRVLRFASGVALMTGASAEAVLGQSDFNTTSSGTTARNMSYPTGVFSDPAGHLWVADQYNNRVLRFDNAATKASGAAADGVLGQADFTSGGYATDRNRMYCPSKVAVAAGRLWVSDHCNHRVLRFENAATKENGADADGVLGQADFISGGYATTRNGMYYPKGIAVSMQGTLFISENMNHRVLRFDNAATKENGADADGVLGQADFTSKISATTQNGMSVPVGVSCDNAGRLYVAEYGNSRVLMFDNAASKPNGANADSVLGQPDFTTRTANDQGISSRTLNSP
ncbi:MAG TPA: NHL repeat-containing protein, partial [Methylomicrobium sp.]|nr:NHL repeat-containing protein [Methylomicrobium sp.]